MSPALITTTLAWILFGVLGAMFRPLPFSFGTPFIGWIFFVLWTGFGLALAVNVVFWRRDPPLTSRTRGVTLLAIAVAFALLLVAPQFLAGLGEALVVQSPRVLVDPKSKKDHCVEGSRQAARVGVLR